MSKIMLLREDVQNSNKSLREKVRMLELVECHNVFCETKCSNTSLIEQAYVNIRAVIDEIKNISDDNYQVSEESANKIKAVDDLLGG